MERPRALGSRYELIELLGAGAMGQVWRARDARSGTDLAAKLLLESYAHDHDIVARFIQERSILMALNHPNIVRVHDLVVEGDVLAIVMDLVEGPNLGTYLKSRGTLGTREAITATIAVLDALASAHALGCLHRDVKPDNVLLDRFDNLRDEGVRLSDFSISRIAEEASIQSTGLLGTPAYMSPELVRDGIISTASDVYSTGVLLYELLAGRTPFAGNATPYQVGDRHVKMAPPPLPVAPELWRIIETMLSKDPGARRSALGTAAALRELPRSAVDAAPLPRQPQPETWEPASHDSLPPDATRISLNRRSVPGPSTGRSLPRITVDPALRASPELAGLSVDRTGGSLTGGSVTGAAAPGGHADRRGGHPAWWIAGGAALVAVVAVVVALVVGAGGGGGPSPGGSTSGPDASVSLQPVDDPVLPTGLTVQRLASYDGAQHQVTLTTRYGAQQFPLAGSLLDVLPRSHGRCPDPTWTGDTTPTSIQSGSRGVVAGCAYSVDFTNGLAKQGSRTVTAVFKDDLGDDPSAALTKLVKANAAQTKSALALITGSEDFAVQRLTGVTVRLDGQARVGRVLPLSVVPQWVGGVADPEAIFTTDPTTPTNAVTDAVTDVAGGTSGVTVTSSCPEVQVTGVQVTPKSTVQGCHVTVTVGQLAPARTGELDIVGARS